MALAIVRDGKLIKSEGYGYANLELRVPVSPESVFALASVTKQFTATAIMLLVQDRKMELDDPISKYIEGTPATWNAITVRQLLTNTSGIKNSNDLFVTNGHFQLEGTTPEKVLQWAIAQPLEFEPGSKWQYSNTNYHLLTIVISKASGESFDQLVKDRLFEPLGMNATQGNSNSEIIRGKVSGYDWTGNRYINSQYIDPSLAYGAGNIVSSVLDLAKWDSALSGDKLLTKESKQLLWNPVRLNDGTSATSGEGLGWFTDPFLGNSRVYISGTIPGFNSLYARFPEQKLSIILLGNNESGSTYNVAMHIAGMVDSTLSHPPQPIARFSVDGTASQNIIPQGNTVKLTVTIVDSIAPVTNGVIQVDISDNSGKKQTIFQQNGETYDIGQSKIYTLTWTPSSPGTYHIGVGVYAIHKDYEYVYRPSVLTVLVK